MQNTEFTLIHSDGEIGEKQRKIFKGLETREGNVCLLLYGNSSNDVRIIFDFLQSLDFHKNIKTVPVEDRWSQYSKICRMKPSKVLIHSHSGCTILAPSFEHPE